MINHQDVFGCTALHYACREGHLNIVKHLIDAGADPDIRENYGFTPTHESVVCNNLEILTYLVEKNCDCTIGLIKDYQKYKAGDTPLDLAKKGGKKKITEFLSNL